MAGPTNADIMAALSEMKSDLEIVKLKVGDEHTGLVRQVAELVSLKNRGIGFIGAVTLFGVLILAGLKSWLSNTLIALRGVG